MSAPSGRAYGGAGPSLDIQPTADAHRRSDVTSIVIDEAPAAAVRPAAPLVAAGRRLAADALAAVIALAAVALVRGILTPYAASAMAAGWVAVLAVAGRPATAARGWATSRATLRGATTAGLLGWVATALTGADAREALGFTVAATVTTLVLRSALVRGRVGMRTLVLADSAEELEAAAGLVESTAGRLIPIGACGPAELDDALARLRPDLVLALPCSRLSGRALQRVTWQVEAAGVPIAVSTRLADVAAARTEVERLGTLGVLHLAPAHRTGPRGWVKTAWECAAALALTIALALPLLAIAVLVRLDSTGPALFRQTRIGRDGRPFTMIKFRTMHVDADARLAELRELDESDGVLFKMHHDPRVTRIGRILRTYSLDELPQLVNVVRGEMALVGPRPALPAEVAAYDDDPRHRLVVKPGITGLWQVSGRSDLSWAESVRLDLDYVDNWSIRGDLLILARTVGAVLGHRGAY